MLNNYPATHERKRAERPTGGSSRCWIVSASVLGRCHGCAARDLSTRIRENSFAQSPNGRDTTGLPRFSSAPPSWLSQIEHSASSIKPRRLIEPVRRNARVGRQCEISNRHLVPVEKIHEPQPNWLLFQNLLRTGESGCSSLEASRFLLITFRVLRLDVPPHLPGCNCYMHGQACM